MSTCTVCDDDLDSTYYAVRRIQDGGVENAPVCDAFCLEDYARRQMDEAIK